MELVPLSRIVMDRKREREMADFRRQQADARTAWNEDNHRRLAALLELSTEALAGLAEFDQLVERAAAAQPSLEEHAWAIKDALVAAMNKVINPQQYR